MDRYTTLFPSSILDVNLVLLIHDPVMMASPNRPCSLTFRRAVSKFPAISPAFLTPSKDMAWMACLRSSTTILVLEQAPALLIPFPVASSVLVSQRFAPFLRYLDRHLLIVVKNIREVYSFIANNYTPGDEIILIGFSRGAFTARSVAGMISEIGLLTLDGMNSFYAIFKDQENFRQQNYHDIFPTTPFPNKPPYGPNRSAEYKQRLLEVNPPGNIHACISDRY